MAIDAVQTVLIEEDGRKEIDIKRYAKVEKIPGGEFTGKAKQRFHRFFFFFFSVFVSHNTLLFFFLMKIQRC
jgi:hypothetical protein